MLTLAQQEKIKKQDFKTYYPKYTSERLIVKKYGDGFVVALPNHLEVSLNEIAMDFLELCTGTLSIFEILQNICGTYDAHQDVLTTEFLNFLYDAWSAGMLQWVDGKNIFLDVYSRITKTGKQYSITEHSKIVENLRTFDEKAIYSALYKKNVRYSAAKIESANQKFGTLYFDCTQNGIVNCMIGITPVLDYSDHDNLLFYQIDYLYINNTLFSVMEFNEFLGWTASFNDSTKKEAVFELVSTINAHELLRKYSFLVKGNIADDVYFGKHVIITN